MRIGLTPDELLATTWSAPTLASYATRIPGLSVLRGETVALIGEGADGLLDDLMDRLEAVLPLDGARAAVAGTLRIHAQQAARVGIQALAVAEPLPSGLSPAARTLAVADLAGLGGLGLTVLVSTGDVAGAVEFADRVVVVAGGQPVVAYPVLAPAPRTAAQVLPVTRRVQARLAATA